jgi:hypothetical protein
MRVVAVVALAVSVCAGAIVDGTPVMTVPLGLDRYVPVPADNPITA